MASKAAMNEKASRASSTRSVPSVQAPKLSPASVWKTATRPTQVQARSEIDAAAGVRYAFLGVAPRPQASARRFLQG